MSAVESCQKRLEVDRDTGLKLLIKVSSHGFGQKAPIVSLLTQIDNCMVGHCENPTVFKEMRECQLVLLCNKMENLCACIHMIGRKRTVMVKVLT